MEGTKGMSLMMALGQQVNATAITELLLSSDPKFDLIVIGGGAAGYMAAITAAEEGASSVLLLEATEKPLEKVRISGGGRCNVTHACWNPSFLVENYPRGRLPLLGPFSRFATGDAVGWFHDHGLDLIEEPDGRMFPEANTSLAVISCLKDAAKAAGVILKSKFRVIKIINDRGCGHFWIYSRGENPLRTNKLILATGSHPTGIKIAADLGHKIVPPLPSLFTLALDAPLLCNCRGISLDSVSLRLTIAEKNFEQIGSILITHWGLSGPAVLRLTAFAAVAFKDINYRSELTVNWLTKWSRVDAENVLKTFRYKEARRDLLTARPFKHLPKRIWNVLLQQAQIDPRVKWSDLTSKAELKLLNVLFTSKYKIIGKGPFGEEFVTAGGVDLSQVNLAKMESRICPGLFFAGEILDVDGVTGGFNFQHCWTSGWLAGLSIAKSL